MKTNTLSALLLRHEGLRLKPYDDATGLELKPGMVLKGNISIGVGRNLGKGITKAEAEWLLGEDERTAQIDTMILYGMSFMESLDRPRQAAIDSLAFNLGRSRLAKFKKFKAAVLARDWPEASKQLRESRWAEQVQKQRVKDLCEMLEKGEWPE